MKTNLLIIRKLLFFLTTLLIFQTSFSQKCMDLGVGVNVDNNEYAFIDFFLGGRAWEIFDADGHPWYKTADLNYHKVVQGEYWTYDQDWSGDIDNDKWGDDWADCYIFLTTMMFDQGKCDERGFPLQVPFTLHKYLPKSVDPDQGLDYTKPIQINQVRRKIYFPADLPQDGWILKWKGKGTIRFQGIEVLDSDVPYTVMGNSWTNVPGYAGKDIEFVSIAGGRVETKLYYMQHGWWFDIMESDPTDPIRDIVFLYPGLETNYDAGEIFHPMFLERMRQFSSLRFMGALSSNGLRSKDIVPSNNPYFNSHYLKYFTWDQRSPFNWYKSNNGNGLAYEYIIELANLTKIDPWVNLPYSCGTDYADSIVNFFLERLDPDLTLYLEIGNELWNTNYGGFHWIDQKKFSTWPGLDNSESRGAYLNEIFEKITEVAGPQGLERIKRVVGAWPKYMSTNRRMLENMDPVNWDCFATTFYYDLGRSMTTCLAPSGKSWREELYDWHIANPTDQQGFNERFRDYLLEEFRCKRDYANDEDIQMAKIYDKEIMCYEGGNHSISGCVNGINKTELPGERVLDGSKFPEYITDNTFINAACKAEESPELAEVLDEVLDSLLSAGYTLSNFLAFSGRSSCYGSWPLIQADDLNQDLNYLFDHYPKFKLFSDRIVENNCDAVYIDLTENTKGPGLSILLDGLNDHVEGTSSGLPNETSNYTSEAWFNYRHQDRDQVIISFVNDGANDNYNNIRVRDDNKLVWEIGNNGTFHMKLVGPVIDVDEWHHVSTTKSNNRYTLYLDGKNVASGNYTLSSSARNHFTIGSVYDGAYGENPFGGEIDEVRLWSVARTENEIRDYMCKKVPVGYSQFSNLIAYYRFDRPDQSNGFVYDMASGSNTGNLKNITFTQRSRYNVSGAPIGDISKFVYSYDWSTTGVTLKHPDGDMLAVSNIANGTPDGVHVYLVDEGAYYNDKPEYYEGIIDNRYYGVYVAGGNDVNYDVTYVYDGNPQSLSGGEESKHRLLRRDNSNDEEWRHSGAKLDEVVNALTVGCKETNRGEYTLGFRQTNTVTYPGPGNALRFDYIVPAEEEEGGVIKYLNLTDYTVTCWTKGTGEIFNFTEKFKRGEERFKVVGNTEVSAAFRYTNGVSNSAGFDPGTSPAVARVDEWVHWAVTRKGTKITVYANGREVVSKDFLGTQKIEELRIFDQRGIAIERDLTMDELTVWNVALEEQEIRDWMCRKITDEHPYECENLILYFNFDEGNTSVLEDTRGPSDMVMYSVGEYVPSGAAVGDESVHDYVTPDNFSFTHPNGDYIEVNKSSQDVVNGIQLYRVDNNPPDPSTVSGSAINSMDSSRYWGMFIIDAYDIDNTYDVVNHFGKNNSVVPGNETEVRMLSRNNHEAINWTANSGIAPNMTDTTVILSDKTSSEFVLGGTTANTFITDCTPAQPVFVAEAALINPSVICGNATGLAYVVANDPMVESYIWTLPSGISGFSTSDTINVNAELGYVSPPAFDISVKAVNRCGESAEAIYSVTINASSTLADAGPDQLILPPETSAVMDGNSVSGGETGTWSLGTIGAGTFGSTTDPLTNVSSMATGTNYFVWTIDNGMCQPSTDTVKIIVAPPPQDIIDPVNGELPTSVCEGSVYVFEAVPPEDIIPDSYQWILPDGLNLIGQNGTQATIQVTSGIGGKIELSAVYAGIPSDPIESTIINVREMPVKPLLSNDNDTVCLFSTFNFTALIDPSIERYEWVFPPEFVPTVYPTHETYNINLEIQDSLVGYVKVIAHNGECTSDASVDSMLVRVLVGPSPPEPARINRYSAQPRYDLCKYDNALLFVQDNEPEATYVWEVPSYVPHEFITENHSAGLFDITNAHTEEIYVRKVLGTGACSVSAPMHIPTTSKTTINGQPVGAISLVAPVAQDPMDLIIGQEYTFESSGTQDYFWHLPQGVEFVDDGTKNDFTITILVTEEFTGYLEVYGLEVEGCNQDMQRIALCSNPIGNCLLPPEYVSGITEFCQGTNLNVTVENISGATEYEWTLPNGHIETTPTNVIDYTINDFMYGEVSVIAKNTTGQSLPATFYMRILANPMPAIEFVDEDNNVVNFLAICQTDNRRPIYIRDIGAEDYTWDIDNQLLWNPTDPLNGDRHDAKSSASDTFIYINADENRYNNAPDPGTMTIVATNSCGGAPVNSSIPYDRVVPPDNQMPAFVESPTSVCVGSSATYSLEEVLNAEEYIWTIPSGFVAQSLVTTIPELTVDIQAGSGGVITVFATSAVCGGGNSPTQTSEQITIAGEPVDFDFIEAPLAGCPGDNITYTVNDPGTGDITWTIPDGLSPNNYGEIIIDNNDPECVQFGNWTLEPDATNVNGDYLRQGDCDLNCIDGKRNSYDTYLMYTPNIPVTGRYKVYYSYNYANTDMYVDIKDISGIQTFNIDQRTTPADGLWEYMGLFEFDAGTDGYMKVNTVGSGGNQNIASDAMKLVLVEEFVTADTSITFEIVGGGNGSLCVTVDNPQCESGYSVCTEPINVEGTMDDPIFIIEENSVCETQVYEFSVSDIGADTYTWLLPSGMSIGGQTGVVTGLTRTENVTMDINPGVAVQIGVSGVINSCGVNSDTVFTGDIVFNGSGCKLADPIFIAVVDTTCGTDNIVFTVATVVDAENYQWSLPLGLQQTGTGLTGTVITSTPSITLTPTAIGSIGVIMVTATAPLAGIESSNQVATIDPVVVVGAPAFGVTTLDLTSCTSNDGVLIITGLDAISTYNISYFDGTSTQGPGSFTSDGGGQLTITGLPAATYSAIDVSVGSCSTLDAGSYTISANMPTVTLSAYTDICINDTVLTLTGGMPISGTYTGTGVTFGKFDPAIAGVGSHTITYEYTETPGCSNTATATITVNALPSGTLSSDDVDNNICEGESVSFNANGGDNYSFKLNGIDVVNNSSGSYFLVTPVDGDVIGVDVSLMGCTASYADVSISIVPLPTGTLISSHDTICEGVDVSFTATGGIEYDFMINGFVESSSILGTYITNSLSDGDEVSVRITDANGCENMVEETISVGIISAPRSDIKGLFEICPGTPEITYTAKYLHNVDYTWEVEGEDAFVETSDNTIEVDWSTASEGIIYLNLHDNNTDCEFDTSLTILLSDNEDPSMLCPESDEVDAVLENGIWHYVISDINSSWKPEVHDNCEEETGFELSFSVNGGLELDESEFISYELVSEENEIVWTAKDYMKNEYSCPPGEIKMIVNESVPKAFSPNGDGINDYWDMPFLQLYDNCIVKVFNRQGKTVYESQRGYTDPWEGNSYGKQLPMDSYFYIITFGNGEKPRKGVITIIK